MKAWGINRRILTLALMPAVVIGLILYGYFVQSQLHLLDDSLTERGKTIAQQLAPASEFGVVTGNTTLLTRLATAVLAQDDVVGIRIVNPDSLSVLHVGSIGEIDSVSPAATEGGQLCAERLHTLLFCAPILRTRLQVSDFPEPDPVQHEPEVLGWIFVELTTTRIELRRLEAVIEALFITGVLLLLIGMAATVIARQLSQPIVQLTGAVQEVARGNLALRTPATTGGEIGALQEGINQMTAALRAARDEMQGQVDAATARLRLTLLELEEKNLDLDEQRRKAQAASLAKGQFLANMSHEIRTPLSGITGMLALLEQTELQSTQRAYVSSLTLAAKALHTLLNDILDLSRIEVGKLQVVEQALEPRTVIDEVALLLAPSAHEKDIDLIFQMAPEVPAVVLGDSLRLRQVLINLVSNAIKFTEQGCVIIRCGLAKQMDDGRARVRFEVEDTGIGIPQDKQQTIFESFTQLDSSTARKYGGSGLGTTIARELVQLMEGQIGVTSEVGKGSLFWFELPAQVVTQDLARLIQPELQGRGILIVDTNPVARTALQQLCEQAGLRVVAAKDAAMARALLRQNEVEGWPPLVVLLVEDDRQARWLELARTLAAEKGAAQLCHVTFFNGESAPDLFACHLNKPVTLAALDNALMALLPHATSAAAPAGRELPARPCKVLVAEDNRINALVIQEFLRNAGHEVRCVENGHAALEALAGGGYDIVFMDMRMPGMDGLEATQRWRARERTEGGHLPVIALTANAMTEDREQCLAAGMDDFLTKPIEQENLLNALAQHVRHA